MKVWIKAEEKRGFYREVVPLVNLDDYEVSTTMFRPRLAAFEDIKITVTCYKQMRNHLDFIKVCNCDLVIRISTSFYC
ncbi:hypothetical protein MKW94_022182 [Papaver nudicaule]|uniref:Uncharacterized protein n=1 Tax=Papaver nudicaule TaxID=74823 RepID=A0AA41W345_PAPNU|nr:hypothetical protein [Papaver nudicaule]